MNTNIYIYIYLFFLEKEIANNVPLENPEIAPVPDENMAEEESLDEIERYNF